MAVIPSSSATLRAPSAVSSHQASAQSVRAAFEAKRTEANAALSKAYGKDIKLGVEARGGRLFANVYVNTAENERIGDAFAARLLEGAMAKLNIAGLERGSVKAARDGRFVQQAVDFSEF